MKKAFTLAEVLITLRIVGVVAAMTIPSLINYYKVKELEVRFKKADAIIQQALLKTANEAGYDSIQSFNIPRNSVTNENLAELRRQVDVMNEFWLKQFVGIERFKRDNAYYSKRPCRTIDGQIEGMFRTCWYSFGTPYQLPNGMVISDLRAQNGGINHPGIIQVFFDTNGPSQGPNRWGHDIFLYSSDITYSANGLCNPTTKNSHTNYYCYYYAHKNINPAGKNKPYWDMLFKPLSYWQKSDK